MFSTKTFDVTQYKTVGSIIKLFEQQGNDDYLPAMLWTSESRSKNGWQTTILINLPKNTFIAN